MDMLLPVGITLVALAILLLPYYLAGILCRFWLRQVHAKLVALLCATVVALPFLLVYGGVCTVDLFVKRRRTAGNVLSGIGNPRGP